MSEHVCPICFSSVFLDFNRRKKACCAGCGSMERGRLAWVTLSRLGWLKSGTRLLNFAPERFMLSIGSRIIGPSYEAADFSPELFGNASSRVKKIDMCSDLQLLEQNSYDVVMHNHVLEHIPCHVPTVIKQINQLLKPGGLHIFSIPIFPNRISEEDLSPKLTGEERQRRFGQEDHMRLFGRNFMETLQEAGIASDLIDLHGIATEQELNTWRVPLDAISGPSPHRVFVYNKPVL